jgi:hypothetical protein
MGPFLSRRERGYFLGFLGFFEGIFLGLVFGG